MPSFDSRLGMTKAVEPYAVVDDHLELRCPDRRARRRRLEGHRVVLERPGREVDVADLAGQHPAEVLAVEVALDLAVPVVVEIGAVGVEEADLDLLGDRSAPDAA